MIPFCRCLVLVSRCQRYRMLAAGVTQRCERNTIQLDDGKRKGENAWIKDRSLTGRVRLRYALNFFPRSEKFFRELAVEAGFSVAAIRPLSELLDEPLDDLYHQHLLVLSKE